MNQTAFRHLVILAFAFSLLNAQQPLEPPLRNFKQRVEKVRHEFPPPQTDFEILSTWLTGKLLTK
jgi:hypothetical protein